MKESLQIISAALLLVGSVGLMYRNWKRAQPKGWIWLLSVITLVTSVFFWISVMDVEFGVVYFFLLGGINVWILIILVNKQNLFLPRTVTEVKPYASLKINPSPAWFVPIRKFLGVIVVACIASIALCLVIVPLSFVSEVSRLVLAAFSFPMLWSVIAIVLLTSHHPSRATLVLLFASIATLTLFWALR